MESAQQYVRLLLTIVSYRIRCAKTITRLRRTTTPVSFVCSVCACVCARARVPREISFSQRRMKYLTKSTILDPAAVRPSLSSAPAGHVLLAPIQARLTGVRRQSPLFPEDVDIWSTRHRFGRRPRRSPPLPRQGRRTSRQNAFLKEAVHV